MPPSGPVLPRGTDRAWLALSATLFVLGVVYFFWPAFASGFARLPGDLGDFRFIDVVVEHWYRMLRGQAAWRDMSFFHPQPGVLGYSDALLGYAIPYAVFRLAGLSPYYAFFPTMVVLFALNFAATLWLLRGVIRIAWPVALVATVIFVFGNVIAQKIVHPNMFVLGFIPLILGLLWRTVQCLDAEDRRAILRYGGAAAALCALLLYTSFYMGWLTVFLCLLWSVVLLVHGFACERPRIQAWLQRAWRARATLAACLAIFALGLVPFVLTHLPPLLDHGGRQWVEVRSLLPSPLDLVNVGKGNIVWSSTIAGFVPQGRDLAHEMELGFPPMLFLTFVVALAVWSVRLIRACGTGTMARPDRAVACLAVVVGICWILMVKVDGVSLWRLVYAVMPGAGAIRAVFRLQFLLLLAALACIGVLLTAAWDKGRHRWAIAALLAALLVEQVNTYKNSYDAAGEAAWLASIPAPPRSCGYFVVAPNAPRATGNDYGAQLDAMVISQRLGLPTINGYSSIFPRGWPQADILDLRSPGYARAVVEWMWTRKLPPDGLCVLALDTGNWTRPVARTDVRGRNLVRPADSFEDALAVELTGFQGAEPTARWTDGNGRIELRSPAQARVLTIAGDALRPGGTDLRIAVDGATVVETRVDAGPFRYEIALSAPVRRIDVNTSSFVPREVGMNADTRRLGVAVKEISLH